MSRWRERGERWHGHDLRRFRENIKGKEKGSKDKKKNRKEGLKDSESWLKCIKLISFCYGSGPAKCARPTKKNGEEKKNERERKKNTSYREKCRLHAAATPRGEETAREKFHYSDCLRNASLFNLRGYIVMRTAVCPKIWLSVLSRTPPPPPSSLLSVFPSLSFSLSLSISCSLSSAYTHAISISLSRIDHQKKIL